MTWLQVQQPTVPHSPFPVPRIYRRTVDYRLCKSNNCSACNRLDFFGANGETERESKRESGLRAHRRHAASCSPSFSPIIQSSVNTDGKDYQWRASTAELGAIDSGTLIGRDTLFLYSALVQRFCILRVTRSKSVPSNIK